MILIFLVIEFILRTRYSGEIMWKHHGGSCRGFSFYMLFVPQQELHWRYLLQVMCFLGHQPVGRFEKVKSMTTQLSMLHYLWQFLFWLHTCRGQDQYLTGGVVAYPFLHHQPVKTSPLSINIIFLSFS